MRAGSTSSLHSHFQHPAVLKSACNIQRFKRTRLLNRNAVGRTQCIYQRADPLDEHIHTPRQREHVKSI